MICDADHRVPSWSALLGGGMTWTRSSRVKAATIARRLAFLNVNSQIANMAQTADLLKKEDFGFGLSLNLQKMESRGNKTSSVGLGCDEVDSEEARRSRREKRKEEKGQVRHMNDDPTVELVPIGDLFDIIYRDTI